MYMKTSINELEYLDERAKKYRIYERMEEMHLSFAIGRDADQNLHDALADKWGMLAYADSNIFMGSK